MRAHRFLQQCFLACVALVSFAASASAEPTANRLQTVIDRGVLRVGTTGDYKPFSYKMPNSGQFVGLDWRLLRALPSRWA